MFNKKQKHTSTKSVRQCAGINESIIAYTLHRNTRARHVILKVDPRGTITMTVPYYVSIKKAEQFLKQHEDWIVRHRRTLSENNTQNLPSLDYIQTKQSALTHVQERLAYFNTLYGYTWHGITIRNQTTRWGSCSRRGTFSFNYRIMGLPETLRDYVIVHELCHRGAFNHSPAFWNLVARAIPDYQARRKAFKKIPIM